MSLRHVINPHIKKSNVRSANEAWYDFVEVILPDIEFGKIGNFVREKDLSNLTYIIIYPKRC